ncbi:restriction endonuclease subunit S, partial [Vibrio splendidus]
MGSDFITKIGRVAEVFDGPHATPKKIDTGPYFLSISSLEGGQLDLSKSAHVSEEQFTKWTKRVTPREGDVLFSYETRLGEAALMPGGIKACLGRRMGLLRPDLDVVLPEYLLYAYLAPAFQTEIKKRTNHGATVNRIALKELPDFDIRIPPLDEQRNTVEILKSMNEKLSLNNQINQTLEQMAQTLFKSWFVDFEPVKAKMNGEQPKGMDAATASLFPEKLVESELGLIPEGWEVNQLSDICKNHSQSYNLKSVDEVVFVNTGDVQEGDFLHKNYSPVVGLPGQAKKAIKEDDILYSEIRPKNKRFAYVDFDVSDYVVSTKFMVIQANEKVHPRLLYMILTRQNTIDEFNIIADSRSGTFPQITFKAISNLEFCMA